MKQVRQIKLGKTTIKATGRTAVAIVMDNVFTAYEDPDALERFGKDVIEIAGQLRQAQQQASPLILPAKAHIQRPAGAIPLRTR